MNKEQALHSFWNSFGVAAYDETTVPDKEELPQGITYPYITYNMATDSLGNVISLHADLWDRSDSWLRITQLKDAIAEKISGENYETIKFDNGYIYIAGGTPFAQRLDDEVKNIKRIYINAQAEFLCAY